MANKIITQIGSLPCGMGTKLYTVQDCPKELKKLRVIAEEIHR